jgi:hypothetical protein
MPSNSLGLWQTVRRAELDQIADAHAAVGGTGPGRRYATQQINQAYAMLLSSQFQGFCRDLHSEAVDCICRDPGGADMRLLMLQKRLTTGRKLDEGNPNPGNLGSDFGFFNFDFWQDLYAQDARNADRNKQLDCLNKWRNAIAHQNFDPQKLGGQTKVRLADVRRWRRVCEELAVEFDAIVGTHLGIILGASPW